MFKSTLLATFVACLLCKAYASDIEKLSIYANRTATSAQEVLAGVSILEKEDILNRQAIDLPSLLGQLPGVNYSKDGGRGQNASVYVRGGNTGHTLVLVDGVRVGSATLGYQALSMLSLEMIERIEVIRGPRAALYGSDALSGVIAITTRNSQALEVIAHVGSYGQMGTDISIGHKIDKFTLKAALGASRSDGFNSQSQLDKDKDGYDQQYLKLAADYQTHLGLFSAQGHVNSGRYDFDTSWGDEDRSHTLHRAYLLGWQQQWGAFSHQAQLSTVLDDDTTVGPHSKSPFITERDEFSYQVSTEITPHLTLLSGLNWYQESVEKSVTAYELQSRINKAIFSALNYKLGSLTLEATGRRDVVSHYAGQSTWQLAAGYNVNDALAVRVSRGSAFKLPTFNELYYPNYANPDLKPQESISDEMALVYQKKNLKAEFAWFSRDVTNLIQGIEQANNVKLATIKGVEFSAHKSWHLLSSDFSYTWLDSENKTNGKMLERRPKHTINWRANYHADKWSFFITADYQSETYQGMDWNTGLDLAKAPSHTLWGFGASMVVTNQFTLRANVKNVFDKDYFTNLGYETEGVNFSLSLSYTAF